MDTHDREIDKGSITIWKTIISDVNLLGGHRNPVFRKGGLYNGIEDNLSEVVVLEIDSYQLIAADESPPMY